MDVKVSKVVSLIEEHLPKHWAEEWDNVGLLLGDPDAPVHRIAVALDPGPEQLLTASSGQYDLLITHHPLLFQPLKKIILNTPVANSIALSLSNGVAVYAAHTNWDSSPVGVNYILATALELKGVSPLARCSSDAWGVGAVGILSVSVEVKEFLKRVRENWNLSHLRVYGNLEMTVRKIALCGGSGGNFWRDALESGAEVYLTADMNYHTLLDATNAGLCVVIADHGEMERVSIPPLAQQVQSWTGVETRVIRESALVSTVITE